MQLVSPKWVDQSFFYHVYPLGACGHSLQTEHIEPQKIDALIPYIPKWKELGVNALYLGPVFYSATHGYDTIDYYKVDPRLGTEKELKEFIRALKNQGIQIIFDAVFNHTGREFHAFRDILEHRENSKFVEWYKNVDFSGNNQHNDGFSYETWAGFEDLVKLDVDNPEVQNYLFEVIEHWIMEYEIDGLRLDAADQLSMPFLEALNTFCKQLPEPLWLMGELLHGNYNDWVNPKRLHSCTNYELYKGLYSSFNEKNFYEIAHSLKRQFGAEGIYSGLQLYNFADNHDVNRIASTLKDEQDLYPLHILLFTVPGIPSIYYESEYGVQGKGGETGDEELRPAIGQKQKSHPDLFTTIQKLAGIHAESEALQTGDYQQLFLGHEQLAFLRKSGNQEVLMIVNANDQATTINFLKNGPYDDDTMEPEEMKVAGRWKDVLNENELLSITADSPNVEVFPKWGRVLARAE